jgi:hypothetical protein
MRILKAAGLLALVALVAIAGYVSLFLLGSFGASRGPGSVTPTRVPESVLAARSESRSAAARLLGVDMGALPARQILFGDLHVHTTFSSDAFVWSLPIMQGEGAHPPADACDFARFCSGLDFWSINDHAESLTPRRWRETRETIRACNRVSGDAANPDVVAFTGWEWTQVGDRASAHYGHKNVIFRETADERLPARAIAAGGPNLEAFRRTPGSVGRLLLPTLDLGNRQQYYDFDRFLFETAEVPLCEPGVDVRELPADCAEAADTPRVLFEKLDQWGFDSIVIPHGTTWGSTAPRGASWRAQQLPGYDDPARQTLIEVYSGHGNSEQYRDWRGVLEEPDGTLRCPEPSRDYTPSCWRAGEIIRERCLAADLDAAECERRAALARQHHVDAGKDGPKVIPARREEEWLDAGQCRDCFLPAYDYRPAMSVQAALALRDFGSGGSPRGYRFGLIASSDNHAARPGSGYKEFGRVGMTDHRGLRAARFQPAPGEPEPRSIPPDEIPPGLPAAERMASFWLTGGLVAAHAEGRDRDSIWRALRRGEVYGSSGPRILLWFELQNAGDAPLPMGSSTRLGTSPEFRVRAVGAFEQAPGCPEHAKRALGPERLISLCMGECDNPTDTRHTITRIEVVRIRPQTGPDEPIASLIDDPWRTLACARSPAGCVVEFSDPEFVSSGRDALYYVRAIQAPTPAVNGGGLRCEYDADGRCTRVHPCSAGYRTPLSDDCLADVEERAWSSPIFVEYEGP